MSERFCALKRLSKSFGALRVADGMSLDILAGETHAIIGPNGAGKTSLINQISGALAPDGGPHPLRRPRRHRSCRWRRARIWVSRAHSRSRTCCRASRRWRTWRLPCRRARARASASGSRRPRSGPQPRRRMDALDSRRARGARAHAAPARCRTARSAGSRSPSRWRRRPSCSSSTSRWRGPASRRRTRLVATLKGLKRHYTIVLVEHDMQAVFALADRISRAGRGPHHRHRHTRRPCAPIRPCAPPTLARRHELGAA